MTPKHQGQHLADYDGSIERRDNGVLTEPCESPDSSTVRITSVVEPLTDCLRNWVRFEGAAMPCWRKASLWSSHRDDVNRNLLEEPSMTLDGMITSSCTTWLLLWRHHLCLARLDLRTSDSGDFLVGRFFGFAYSNDAE